MWQIRRPCRWPAAGGRAACLLAPAHGAHLSAASHQRMANCAISEMASVRGQAGAPFLGWVSSSVSFPRVMRPWRASTICGTLGRATPKHLAGRTVLTQSIKQRSYLKLCIRRGRRGNTERSESISGCRRARTHQKKTKAPRRSGLRTQAAGLEKAAGRRLAVWGSSKPRGAAEASHVDRLGMGPGGKNVHSPPST